MPKTPLSFYLHIIAVAVIVVAVGRYLPLPSGEAETMATHRFRGEGQIIATPAKESVYDRVMRTGTIRCGYAVWPPYIRKNANTGGLEGMNYDYINELGKVLDLKIDWAEEVGWGNLIEGLNTGRYDLICASMWPDAGRIKNAALTIPAFYTASYVYVRADDARFDGKPDLLNQPNIKFAAIDGDVTYSLAKNNFPNAAIHSLPASAEGAQIVLELTGGKADAIIFEKAGADDFLNKNPGSIRPVMGIPLVNTNPEVHAVKIGEHAFLTLINNAILVMQANKTAEKLLAKYQMPSFGPAKPYQLPAN